MLLLRLLLLLLRRFFICFRSVGKILLLTVRHHLIQVVLLEGGLVVGVIVDVIVVRNIIKDASLVWIDGEVIII